MSRSVFAAAALAAACSSSSDPNQVANDIAGELCDLSYRCCTRGEATFYFGPYWTPENCAERMVTSATLSQNLVITLGMFENVAVLLPNLRALDKAVEEGRTKIDRGAVDACLTYLRAVECNQLIEEPEGCEPPELIEDLPCDPELLFLGNVGEGGTCSSPGTSFECREGLTCLGSSLLGVEGACVAPGDIGDFCRVDNDCVEDLYCSALDGTCQLPGEAGDVCAYSNPDDPSPAQSTLLLECGEGLSCDPVSDTCVARCDRGAICGGDEDCDVEAGLTCVAGRCDLPRPYGLPCAVAEHCQEGLRCLPSAADFGALLCIDPLANDEPCSPSAHEDCESGFCDPDTFRCASPLEVGNPCTRGIHEECGPIAYCDRMTCDPFGEPCPDAQACQQVIEDGLIAYRCATGTCVPTRADDQTCQVSYHCRSETCIAGSCQTPPLQDGDQCTDGTQCESQYCGYGAPRVCDTLPLPNGKPCLTGFECESGVCHDAMCNPGLAEGAPCAGVGDPPCGIDLYCDPERSTPICTPVLNAGEVCKGSYQCRGDCVSAHARTVCDDTPPLGGLVCDGEGGTTETQ